LKKAQSTFLHCTNAVFPVFFALVRQMPWWCVTAGAARFNEARKNKREVACRGFSLIPASRRLRREREAGSLRGFRRSARS
jgi:hypothetical protein